jgi:hypothetical protein
LSREQALAHSAKRLAPNPAVDRVARAVLRAEHDVARRVPLPFGLSVLGVYRVAGEG